jgi:DNA-binding Lrp family transcriptional regulator
MARAYLNANLEAGRERDARGALRKINGVKSAEFVTGSHDLLALIEGNSYEDIASKTLSDIRNVPGVSETVADFVFGW